MDRNKDGVVTIEEFIESCKKVGQKSGKEQLNIFGNLELDKKISCVYIEHAPEAD